MTKKEMLRVFQLIDDLNWEVDRMSECGVETLVELERIVKGCLTKKI